MEKHPSVRDRDPGQDPDGSRPPVKPPRRRCGLGGGTTIHRETLGRKQEVQESVNMIDSSRLVFLGQGWGTRVDSVSREANRRYLVESISSVSQHSLSSLMDKNCVSPCQGPGAAIINDLKAAIYSLTVLGTRSLKSSCLRVYSLWWFLERILPAPSGFWWPQAFIGLWLHHHNFCLCVTMASISSICQEDTTRFRLHPDNPE